MKEIYKYLISGGVTLVLSVFLPKNVLIAIREFFKFLVQSILKLWWAVLMLLMVPFVFRQRGGVDSLGTEFWLFYCIVIFIFVATVALILELKQKFKPLNLGIYGCYSVKESEYLTSDMDSEFLNQQIGDTVKSVGSRFYIYKRGYIRIHQVKLPKFIPILLGSQGLERFIRRRTNYRNHFATLYFIRNISNHKLSVFLNCSEENVTHAEATEKVTTLLNNLSSDVELSFGRMVQICTKIYLLVFGQIFIDFMLMAQKFKEVHYLLDDSIKLISEIKSDLTVVGKRNQQQAEKFLNFWLAYLERYRSIVFIEQKEYKAAVDHIFRSIKLNPYYPYESYDELKEDYVKKYGIGLSTSLISTNEELDNAKDNEQIASTAEELSGQVKYRDATFNDEIIKEIMRRNDTDLIIQLIEDRLNKLDDNDPFQLLMKAEVIKYLRKGEAKINEMWVDRVDESIQALRKIIELEPGFTFIKTKLGSILWLKGIHYNNERMIEEGLKEWSEGMHYMSELGFRYKTEEERNDNQIVSSGN